MEGGFDTLNTVTLQHSQDQLDLLCNYVDGELAALGGPKSTPKFVPIPRKWFEEAMPAFHQWLLENQRNCYGHISNPESVLFRGVFIYPENTQ